MGALTLLLPPRSAYAGAPVPDAFALILGRGDVEAAGAASNGQGWRAQLARHFVVRPAGIPVAPLMREADCGDGTHGQWLRADPASVRADMAAGRMLACGDLGLSHEEADALLQPLKPLFGDEGVPISAGAPDRWYLMVPADAKLPRFADPDDALGDDLHSHLPAGAEGVRWRRLLNEAQIVLHHHPLNRERAARGQVPVNSLWFWGGGRMPDAVETAYDTVVGDEPLLAALCGRAGVRVGGEMHDDAQAVLVDARRRAPEDVARHVLEPAFAARRELTLDFGDGHLVRWRPSHRRRFWRRRSTAWH